MKGFVRKLREQNIEIDLIDDQLQLDFPEGYDPGQIIDEVRANKADLISYLKKVKQARGYQSIKRSERKPHYVLSSAQYRMYLINKLDPNSTAYNLLRTVKVKGDLDIARLESVFNKLLKRHEILRTYFDTVEKEPVQKIADNINFHIEQFTASGSKVNGVVNDFIRPFDLKSAPLLRVGLIDLENSDEYILMLDLHHIISDGVSQGILIKDFSKLYQGIELPELTLQYKDYSEWQKSDEQAEALSSQKDYWVNEFADGYDPNFLPTDFPRPKNRSYKGDAIRFDLDEALTARLKGMASKSDATMFMVLLSAYYVLLNKLSGRKDLVVGTPVAGRQHEDIAEMMGMFVNTLPLKTHIDESNSFEKLLKSVQQKTLTSFENQAYQYNDLISELNIDRSSTGNQLFDTMFVYQNYEHSSLEIPGLTVSSFHIDEVISKFDAVLTAVESDNRISLMLDYSSDLFKKSTIERFVGFYQKILQEIISNPEVAVADISLLETDEKKRILEVFNDTAIAYPKEHSIPDLFKEIVAEHSAEIALISGSNKVTYGDLDLQSDKIANSLISNGVTAEECVGVAAGRSIESVQAILGILKAGAAYLPLEKDYPASRTAHMLKEGNVKTVLTASQTIKLPENITTHDIISLAQEGEEITLDSKSSSGSLAYVIYTSGSTGIPKGVAVTHQNIVRLVRGCNYAKLDSDTRILQTGAPVFDATTFEIWGALLNGGRLYLESKEVILNTVKLGKYLEEQEINTLWLTSSLFDEHTKNNDQIFAPLKQLLVGGDALTPRSINKVRDKHPHINIINGYGPTENTTFSVCHVIDRKYDHNIPIGKPISNSTAYVVNDKLELQPVGVVGELLVGGDGISRGYLNGETLTTQKFLKSAFKANETVYRTGDLARWLPDGNIEFLGRADNQVKIRGFRVELGEIETRLSSYRDVSQGLVALYDTDGEKSIIGYYVSPEPISSENLLTHMSEALPDYMVPDYFIHLDRIPLTPNGKVNKKELPEPKADISTDLSGAVSEFEVKLIHLYSEILNKDTEVIGRESNFFDLGGNSLKAISLASQIHEVFDFEIMLDEIFDKPDVAALADQIETGLMLKNSIGENDSESTNYVF